MNKKSKKELKATVKEAVCEVASDHKEEFKNIVKGAVGEAIGGFGGFTRPSGGYHVHYHHPESADTTNQATTPTPVRCEICPDMAFEININTDGAIGYTKRTK